MNGKLRRVLGRPFEVTPGVHFIHARHDHACAQIVTGECTCRPDIILELATARALEAARATRRAWLRSRVS